MKWMYLFRRFRIRNFLCAWIPNFSDFIRVASGKAWRRKAEMKFLRGNAIQILKFYIFIWDRFSEITRGKPCLLEAIVSEEKCQNFAFFTDTQIRVSIPINYARGVSTLKKFIPQHQSTSLQRIDDLNALNAHYIQIYSHWVFSAVTSHCCTTPRKSMNHILKCYIRNSFRKYRKEKSRRVYKSYAREIHVGKTLACSIIVFEEGGIDFKPLFYVV